MNFFLLILNDCQAEVASAPAAEQSKVGLKQSFQNLYTVVEQEEEHQDVNILNMQTCAISTPIPSLIPVGVGRVKCGFQSPGKIVLTWSKLASELGLAWIRPSGAANICKPLLAQVVAAPPAVVSAAAPQTEPPQVHKSNL